MQVGTWKDAGFWITRFHVFLILWRATVADCSSKRSCELEALAEADRWHAQHKVFGLIAFSFDYRS